MFTRSNTNLWSQVAAFLVFGHFPQPNRLKISYPTLKLLGLVIA